MAKKKEVPPPVVSPAQAEYERVLTAAVLKHGALVSQAYSAFSWRSEDEYDTDWRRGQPRQSVSCGIAKTGPLEEDAGWYEFAGTDAEQDNYRYGVQVHGVTCNCGKINNRTFRWDAPVGEAIKIVVMELLEEKTKENAPA